jgi:hypothetical protein
MLLVLVSTFVVPTLYCALEEMKLALAELRSSLDSRKRDATEPSA